MLRRVRCDCAQSLWSGSTSGVRCGRQVTGLPHGPGSQVGLRVSVLPPLMVKIRSVMISAPSMGSQPMLALPCQGRGPCGHHTRGGKEAGAVYWLSLDSGLRTETDKLPGNSLSPEPGNICGNDHLGPHCSQLWSDSSLSGEIGAACPAVCRPRRETLTSQKKVRDRRPPEAGTMGRGRTVSELMPKPHIHTEPSGVRLQATVRQRGPTAMRFVALWVHPRAGKGSQRGHIHTLVLGHARAA